MTDDKLPPLELLHSLFHYNPVTGQISYLQQRGPRRPGDPAGCTQGGYPCLFIQGRHWRAARVAWALYHGADPAPHHPIPVDGDPLNLQLANLSLSTEPFVRPRLYRKSKRRQSLQKHIKYFPAEGVWKAWHRRRIIGSYSSKREAIDAKRRAIELESEDA